MNQSNDNKVKAVIAWLRGQEWHGEKPTRGESADALQQLLDAHFRQTGFVDVDIAAALSSDRETIAQMVESELECGQFTDAASIADFIEADRTELQAKIGHLEQHIARLEKDKIRLDTPRTDAVVLPDLDLADAGDIVALCRKLEIELAEAQSRIGGLERDRTELRESVQALLQYLDDHNWGTIPEGETADRARAAIKKAT